MIPTFVDLESFWSAEHTLKKMNPVEYCMHPETELISLAIEAKDIEPTVIFGEDAIQAYCDSIDWSDRFVIAHNMSGFDAMLLAWRLGVRPKMWGCTLAMARPIFAKTVGLSLAKLVQHFGIGVKNDAVLHSTRGRHLKDFTPAEIAAMRVYNGDDTSQCKRLFYKLLPYYSTDELWHIDCNIRMLVEAEFELNTTLLETALSVERSNKLAAIMTLAGHLRDENTPVDWDDQAAVAEMVRTHMASSAKFSAILESRGVAVPMKRSKTDPTKKIPAIAKTDAAMEELLDHDDEVVAAAARARLSVKSTQLETRIGTFLQTFGILGKLPVPAHYCGADTTGRDSGWLYNMYNLPRIYPDRPRVGDALRNSVKAPEGKVVGVADLSGIELRVNHTLWQVERSTKLWQAKADADLYKDTAAKLFEVEVAAVEKPQRQFAKVVELACFAGDTLVLTDSGAKPIESVSVLDWVWDGLEWVRHEGVVCREQKETVQMLGVAATADHEILTAHGWRAWSEVCSDQTLLQSALSMATSPSLPGSTATPGGSLSASAHAGGAGSWLGATSNAAPAPDARHAQNKLRGGRACSTVERTSPPAVEPDAVSWRDCPPPSTGVITQPTRGTATTAGGASVSGRSGEPAPCGSWSTSPHSLGGTLPDSTWTASTTTEGMSQAICGSSRAERTPETAEPSEPWSNASPTWRPNSPVYDLLNCGPRNRFTVLTDAGPVLVHNCGFGIGPDKFRDTARIQGGLKLTPQEAKTGVYGWRDITPEIAGEEGGWAVCDDILNYVAEGSSVYVDPWQLMKTEKDAIILPSGRRIRYPNLRQELRLRHREVDGELVSRYEPTWVYAEGRHEAYLYGGKVDENLVQALARDVIFPNAIEFWRRTGYRPKHKVYDELVYLWPPGEAEALLAELQQVMRTAPKWWPSLVLWSEGDIAPTYGAAK